MTQAASLNGTAAAAPPLPIHGEGLDLFDGIIFMLGQAGWSRLRVDTLVHRLHADGDRDRPTVRHHYDHGTWELWFEKDRYWHPRQTVLSPGVRRALIRLDRPLPTAREVLSQLFGDQFATYAKVPIPADLEEIVAAFKDYTAAVLTDKNGKKAK